MESPEPVDLRYLPVWERAARVLEHAERLAVDQSVEFLTEIDPHALLSRLEQLRPHRFAFGPRCIGRRSWNVTVTRVRLEGVAETAAVFVRNPLLAALSTQGRALLESAMTQAQLRKGQIVCEENEGRDWFGILLEGVLGVFAGAGSRERLLFQLFPFDVFGEIELLDGGLTLGRTLVLSKGARIAQIPIRVVRDCLQHEPRFLMELAALGAQHNRTLVTALSEQLNQPILSRVAAALLGYAAPERGLHPVLPPLSTMTQSQVAAAAGTVKEVAARAIAELERSGALARERGRIAYLDRSKLLATIDRA